jgi:hypothetical protein
MKTMSPMMAFSSTRFNPQGFIAVLPVNPKNQNGKMYVSLLLQKKRGARVFVPASGAEATFWTINQSKKSRKRQNGFLMILFAKAVS